jgi:hypothetical protein
MVDSAYMVYSWRGLDEDRFAAGIDALGMAGKWRPVQWSMRKVLSDIAGTRIAYFQDRREVSSRVLSRKAYSNFDYFLDQHGVVLFIVNYFSNFFPMFNQLNVRRYIERDLGFQGEVPKGVLIGGIGHQKAEVELQVAQLQQDFESAFLSTVDNDGTEEIVFEWRRCQSKKADDVSLFNPLEDGERQEVRFRRPVIRDDEESKTQMELMIDPMVRLILREIGESGFVRTDDLLSKRGSKRQDFVDTVTKIVQSGLVEVEYLIQCRKTSAQLIRVKNLSDLPTEANFRCASCNRLFAEELSYEGMYLSSRGRELTQGSHWMTVWTTERLINLGVPVDKILWNVEDSGEEVDVIIEHLDRIWIFELKDREFSAGDAYPFNYRKSRYKANELVVVTTEKVSADARRVFDDLGSHGPIFIEGLSELEGTLQRSFNDAAALSARIALLIPSQLSGFNLVEWFKADK